MARSNVIAGHQLDVITSAAIPTPPPQVDASNRTLLYSRYVDTAISKLATNSSFAPSHHFENVSTEKSRGAGATSKMEAIVSSLANFSTSESSELLLDTDNGSRNGGAGGGGDLDASERDVELNFRGGSNFMLLLEDFGEYFYNFNGTTDASGGVSGAGAETALGAFGNFSGNYDPLANCSLVNSTCGADITQSK